MDKGIFKEIALKDLRPNPRNPRREFDGPDFDELVASIRQKGILEPILARPIGPEAYYEIVAGGRRFKAAMQIDSEAGGKRTAKIPCIIRDLSDDEAYDIMLIENLQRQDLAEIDQAHGFKEYLDKHPKDLEPLAERTGIRPEYIRRHVAVLALPKPIVDAWTKGNLAFGHLEQFLRVEDEKVRKELFNETIRKKCSVQDVRKTVNEMAAPLEAYAFDKTECATCAKNSSVQYGLFGLGEKQATCLDPKCLKKKLNDWLQGHWKETPMYKKFGTSGFRWEDNVRGSGSVERFYGGGPYKKCRDECPYYVTLLDDRANCRDSYSGVVCIGDRKCMNALQSAARKAQQATTRQEKKEKRDPNAPRVPWHGEYFRDGFLRKRIPELIAATDPEDHRIKALLLASLVNYDTDAKSAVAKALKIRDDWGPTTRVIRAILDSKPANLGEAFKAALKASILEGPQKGSWGGFGTTNRFMAGEFLGVDIAKEWTANEEYLQKKTIKELHAFGTQSKIFSEKKVKAYLLTKLKKDSFAKLKKSELLDLYLKSGINLKGRVPKEILEVKEARY
jgi:ParB family chromosome partitioning protein